MTVTRARLSTRAVTARALYAVLFSAALPAALILWARRLDTLLRLPAYGTPIQGTAIAAAGVALVTAATWALWRFGHGLPASPFPPDRLVTRGPYRFVAHPIYVGAVAVSAGVSLAARSAAGLWIATPVLAAACAVFVMAFERGATVASFGRLPVPLLRLPGDTIAWPTLWDRVSVFVLAFGAWLVAYEAVQALGIPGDARSAYFAWDRGLPVLPWTEAIYALTYVFVAIVPLVANRQRDLRWFAVDGLVAVALIAPIYLLVPLIAEAKPVPGDGWLSALMRFERVHDGPVCAAPSFHVVWACLAARLYSSRWPRLRLAFWPAACAIAASCLTTGMHAALDIVTGFLAYVVIVRASAVWRVMCDGAEALANAWHEIRLGPARLIVHGAYAALGGGLGTAIAGLLAGPDLWPWVVVMALASVVGAGIWAQVVEGSSQLLRPFGYFGSVGGAVLTATAAGAAGADGWRLAAAFAVGATFTQAIGRLRCLVQGCCHGREAPAWAGIRHTHPCSRVVRLAHLAGVPVYPTALISLVWMLFVGACLLRLWAVGAPVTFVLGAYFILAGLGRFVEEHFRGEPQTRVVLGLRLYQWLAIAFVIAGAVVTCVASAGAPPASPLPAGASIPVLALAAFCYAAYGVDLPQSHRRFSRLL